MELTAAEPRRKGLIQLYLDGEAAVKVDAETFVRSGLKLGDELSDEELHQLILDSDSRRAQEKAMYLLEHHSRSKKELENKITQAGIPREAAKNAAGKMEELGLLDDETYARDLARELFLRKKWGAMRVKQELKQKGIDEALVEELLEEYGGEELALENLREVLEKKYPGWQEDEKVRRRAIAAMQRLGYSYELTRRAMRSEDD